MGTSSSPKRTSPALGLAGCLVLLLLLGCGGSGGGTVATNGAAAPGSPFTLQFGSPPGTLKGLVGTDQLPGVPSDATQLILSFTDVNADDLPLDSPRFLVESSPPGGPITTTLVTGTTIPIPFGSSYLKIAGSAPEGTVFLLLIFDDTLDLKGLSSAPFSPGTVITNPTVVSLPPGTTLSALTNSTVILPTSVSLLPGEEQQFDAIFNSPTNQTLLTGVMDWTTNNTDVVAVTNSLVDRGRANALTPGVAEIQARYGKVVRLQALLTVLQTTPTFTILPQNPLLNVSSTLTFQALLDGQPQSSGVAWALETVGSDPLVGTLDSSTGFFTATTPGVGVVRATHLSLNLTTTTGVTVQTAGRVPVSAALFPPDLRAPSGSERQIQFRVFFNDGTSDLFTDQATFTSSDPTSVAVAQGGLCRFVGAGDTSATLVGNFTLDSVPLSANTTATNFNRYFLLNSGAIRTAEQSLTGGLSFPQITLLNSTLPLAGTLDLSARNLYVILQDPGGLQLRQFAVGATGNLTAVGSGVPLPPGFTAPKSIQFFEYLQPPLAQTQARLYLTDRFLNSTATFSVLPGNFTFLGSTSLPASPTAVTRLPDGSLFMLGYDDPTVTFSVLRPDPLQGFRLVPVRNQFVSGVGGVNWLGSSLAVTNTTALFSSDVNKPVRMFSVDPASGVVTQLPNPFSIDAFGTYVGTVGNTVYYTFASPGGAGLFAQDFSGAGLSSNLSSFSAPSFPAEMVVLPTQNSNLRLVDLFSKVTSQCLSFLHLVQQCQFLSEGSTNPPPAEGLVVPGDDSRSRVEVVTVPSSAPK